MAGKKLTDKEIKQVLDFIEQKKAAIEALGFIITKAVGKAKDAQAIAQAKAQIKNSK